MKKLLSALLATLLLLTMLPLGIISVSAESEEPEVYVEGDFRYTVNNGEATLIQYTGREADLVIPLTLGGYPVTTIGGGAFVYYESEYQEYPTTHIVTVSLPDSVVTIGANAFYRCYLLESIDFGNNVQRIESYAFDGCWSLKSFVLPDSVTYVGERVFESVPLVSLSIGAGLKTFYNTSFFAISTLDEITVSEANPYYCAENNVLMNKDKTELYLVPGTATSFVIPDTITVVKNQAFRGCDSLISLVIPTNVKKLEHESVSWHYKLQFICYIGTEEQAKEMEIGVFNDSLNEATWIYNWTPCEEHDYTIATCIDPKYCKVCGVVEGGVLDHTYDNSCDERCNYCDTWRDVEHTYTSACDSVCDLCGATRYVDGHVWAEGACSVCGADSPSKPVITADLKTGYAKMGEKVSVKVPAEGEGLRYEWYIKNNGAKKYSKSSVTTATYSTTMSDKAKDRLVYCVVKDAFGNEVKSKTVRLRESVSITKEPAAAAYAQSGKKVSVKITAKGDGLKYSWYIKNDGASKYSKSSVTSSTYSTTMGSKVKNRRVYCVVKDKYGKSVQSKTFILRESVSITAQPKTVTVAKNKTAKVTVKASGDGLKYTWYIKNAGSSKYSKSSVKTASYSVKMTSKVKNRLVYCVVTDKYGKTVKTVTVKLKMK